MKLVHDDGKVPSIFFPAGTPAKGGTCEFATPMCLERCPSDVRPNALEQWIYVQFREQRADELARTIFMELLDRNKLFLQWFAWGDCPAALTEKVAWIIGQLKEENVTQCGFTRNDPLWRKVKGITRIGLTVEDQDKVVDYCKAYGVVGKPDYETGKVHIYYGIERVEVGTTKMRGAYRGGCGGVWVEDHEYEKADYETRPSHVFEASCELCAEHRRGCFAYELVKAIEDSG